MGAKGSSSKRKSSKRKSSKLSSEARRKKRSRRIKSKKLHRGDPSESSYSDDDSRSSAVSSSSSEDDYRRGRSHKRIDVKGRKKKAKRTYSSSSSRSSEDSRRVKKRRLSKKNDDPVARKKKTKKRKLRRDASVDSVSSDLRSCSTCRSGSRDNSRERPIGRSRGNKNEVDLEKARKRAKSNKVRSPSCSSHSISEDTCGYDSKVNFAGENNSRRLRSVVTIPTHYMEDEDGWVKDGTKEEIVYDHDDYPPSRSNDSNDYSSKRPLGHRSQIPSADKRVDGLDGNEVLTLIRTAGQRENGEDSLVKDDQSIPQHDGVGAPSPGLNNKSEFPATVATSGSEDLESILRQKALDNLRKFRGGFQRENPDLSTNAKADLIDNNSHKEEDSSGVGASQVVATQISHPTRNHGISLEGKSSRVESGAAIKRVVCSSGEVDHSADPQKNPTCIAAVTSKSKLGTSSSMKESTCIAAVTSKSKLGTSSSMKESTCIDAVTSKSKLGKSSSMQESSGTRSILGQALKTLTSPRSKNLSPAESGSNSNASQAMGDSSNNNQGVKVSNACDTATTDEHPSILESSLEESNVKEQKDNGKDASQFEQKTMSVMRGGEMVQVSYKVYIPKNARALGRRQLQR